MAFLQRLGSGIRDGLSSLLGGKDEGKKHEVGNASPQRTLAKISSRGNRPSSAAVGILESHTREAIATYVQAKFDKASPRCALAPPLWRPAPHDRSPTPAHRTPLLPHPQGEAKPHMFTQFWLQFPKLEAGFEVLRRQLEAHTGSGDGPLPLALLRTHASDFGLPASCAVVQDLCSKSAVHKCRDVSGLALPYGPVSGGWVSRHGGGLSWCQLKSS